MASAVRVAVVGYDEPFVPPDWVGPKFGRAGVGCVIANCQTEGEVVDVGRNAHVLLTSSSRRLLTAQVIGRLEVCRALVRVGSGVDCIATAAATRRSIPVYNTPDALAYDVAEHAAALMLGLLHRLPHQDRIVKAGAWDSRMLARDQRLRGKTLGLVGYGRIARALVALLSGLELTCLAFDPYVSPGSVQRSGVRLVGLAELLREADIVSLHVPLEERTYHLIGEPELRQMKPGAVLINTARGPVVDQEALGRALAERRIAGAALDVMEREPPAPDNPLLAMENVVITPHSAAFSLQVLDAVYEEGCSVALDVLAGRQPGSLVNRDVTPWWEAGLASPPNTVRSSEAHDDTTLV